MKNVMLWAGAGQIGMAIARRMGKVIAPGIIVTPLALDEFNGPLKPESNG